MNSTNMNISINDNSKFAVSQEPSSLPLNHVIGTGGFRVTLKEYLGRGAHGQVFRAEHIDPSLKTEYAVKQISKSKLSATRIHMEIKTQSMASDHANVVELHQVVEDEKSVYLIMQYCSGRTLCEAVASAPFGDNYLMDLRTRDVAAATRFIKDTFIQVLDAVARCHSVGVFHRDIKLENILLDEARQTAYLADFGLATTDALSREFRTGTSWYKSPEQQGSETKSSAYSSRHCDIWAMGVLLSCMVAGRPPWQHAETYDHDFASYLGTLNANDLYNNFRASAVDNIPVNHRARSTVGGLTGISEELNALLRKILAVDPLKRIALKEIREELLKITTLWAAPVVVQNTEDAVGEDLPYGSVDSHDHALLVKGWQSELEHMVDALVDDSCPESDHIAVIDISDDSEMDITAAFESHMHTSPAHSNGVRVSNISNTPGDLANAELSDFGLEGSNAFDSFIAQHLPDEDEDCDRHAPLDPTWQAFFISCLSLEASEAVNSLHYGAEAAIWDPTTGMSYHTHSTDSAWRVWEDPSEAFSALSEEPAVPHDMPRPACAPRILSVPSVSAHSDSDDGSDGPITPNTYPVDDATGIHAISDLGLSPTLAISTLDLSAGQKVARGCRDCFPLYPFAQEGVV